MIWTIQMMGIADFTPGVGPGLTSNKKKEKGYIKCLINITKAKTNSILTITWGPFVCMKLSTLEF